MVYVKYCKEINVLPLDRNRIFHEKVKQAYLYSKEVNIYVGIDINDGYKKILIIWKQM